MSLLRLIQRYKQFDFTGFVPVRVLDDQGQTVTIGWTKDDVAHALSELGDVWTYDEGGMLLNAAFDTYEKRTEAVDANLLEASEQGVLPPKPDYSAIGGDDWFVIGTARYKPLFEVRRFYISYLGARRYASRINGFHDGQMWIIKRGQGVDEYPGRLDTLVGAGQIASRTILENTLAEAHEEAGLSKDQCKDLHSVSMVHIFRHNKHGFLYDENIYIYDLDTKGTITPHVVQEWETETIELWPYDKVLHTIKNTEEFRPEAALCLVDFFIRHGVITPDNEPHFDELCFGLRSLIALPQRTRT
jgi:hypothetical protein